MPENLEITLPEVEESVPCPHCGASVLPEDIIDPSTNAEEGFLNGGCDKCAVSCLNCDKIIDKNKSMQAEGDDYCPECWRQNYVKCKDCGQVISKEDGKYVPGKGLDCKRCYNEKSFTCSRCHERRPIELGRKINGQWVCYPCVPEKHDPAETHYPEQTKNLKEFGYNSKSRLLERVPKLLPISTKELKRLHPAIADGLKDLWIAANNKNNGIITPEFFANYLASLKFEKFPVNYSTIKEMQRSVDTLQHPPVTKPQLVINIKVSAEMLAALKANPIIYDLFEKLNQLSEISNHPSVKDQIGWVRLELDPAGEFILVEETQSDHQTAIHRLLTNAASDNPEREVEQSKAQMKQYYRLDDAGFKTMLEHYISIFKSFDNISQQAVIEFARANGYKKIYWHQYENMAKLFNRNPPKSNFTSVPKQHNYKETEERPFGIEGKFFSREAQVRKLNRIARVIELKRLFK